MIKYLFLQLLGFSFLVTCFFLHQDYLRVKEECEQEITRIKARISYLDAQEKEARERRKKYLVYECDDRYIWDVDFNDITLFLCTCGK